MCREEAVPEPALGRLQDVGQQAVTRVARTAGIVEHVLDHPNRRLSLPSAIGMVVDLGQARAVSEPVAGVQLRLVPIHKARLPRETAFGRPGSAREGRAGFPWLRLAGLTECGTHAIAEAAMGPLSWSGTRAGPKAFARLAIGDALPC